MCLLVFHIYQNVEEVDSNARDGIDLLSGARQSEQREKGRGVSTSFFPVPYIGYQQKLWCRLIDESSHLKDPDLIKKKIPHRFVQSFGFWLISDVVKLTTMNSHHRVLIYKCSSGGHILLSGNICIFVSFSSFNMPN